MPRKVVLWRASVANTSLSAADQEAVERHITRDKRTRDFAAEHLLQAYAAAHVALPTNN
jgi:hypothetical protein